MKIVNTVHVFACKVLEVSSEVEIYVMREDALVTEAINVEIERMEMEM